MVKLYLLLLLVFSLVLTGCSSSYNDCKNDCNSIAINKFCSDKGGAFLFQDTCGNNSTIPLNNISEQCFNDCRGLLQ